LNRKRVFLQGCAIKEVTKRKVDEVEMGKGRGDDEGGTFLGGEESVISSGDSVGVGEISTSSRSDELISRERVVAGGGRCWRMEVAGGVVAR
jgi:hypothetical protein